MFSGGAPEAKPTKVREHLENYSQPAQIYSPLVQLCIKKANPFYFQGSHHLGNIGIGPQEGQELWHGSCDVSKTLPSFATEIAHTNVRVEICASARCPRLADLRACGESYVILDVRFENRLEDFDREGRG